MDAADRDARAAIGDILALYCHAIDRRRWDLLERCFHPDATYRFGPIDGTWRDFVTSSRRVLAPLRRSHHQLGQSLFRIAGDGATVETYMTAYHRVPADAPAGGAFSGTGEEQDVTIAGRYLDRFERRGGTWRIARREGLVDWRRTVSAADGGFLARAAAEPADTTDNEVEPRMTAA